jgi:hypothetical protein
MKVLVWVQRAEADGWSSATPWRKAGRHTNLSFGEWSAVFGDAKMGFISDIV